MNTGLVSVIITTYGRSSELINEALASVKNQTYPNIEIIIVDDNGLGSDYQKLNESRFEKEEDVIYIANQRNSGAQVSRNVGILASKGEYIAFLDDDDIWAPCKIDKQVEKIETEDAGLVFCNGYRFYNDDLEDRRTYQFNFIADRPIDFITELRSDRIGSTSHPLMRKGCITRTGLFDPDMPARQDYEMWLRFCRHYKVVGINEPLFYYRYHGGIRITKSYEKEINSYLLLWDKYKKDYKIDSIAKTNILFTIGKTYFKAHKLLCAIGYGVRALLANPVFLIRSIVDYRKKPQF